MAKSENHSLNGLLLIIQLFIFLNFFIFLISHTYIFLPCFFSVNVSLKVTKVIVLFSFQNLLLRVSLRWTVVQNPEAILGKKFYLSTSRERGSWNKYLGKRERDFMAKFLQWNKIDPLSGHGWDMFPLLGSRRKSCKIVISYNYSCIIYY